MIFSLLCKDEWFLMVGFHHCPPMAGNLVFEGTKMSLRGFPSGSRGNLALCPLCHCEPAEGGRGNLVFPKKDWETYHLKNRLRA